MGVAALLPAGFDGWFARCVVREQDQRFANASLSRDALELVLAGASRASTVPQVPIYAAPVAPVATQPAPAGDRPVAGRLIRRSVREHRVRCGRAAIGGRRPHVDGRRPGGADLAQLDLMGIDLHDTDLDDCSLTDADLTGAVLTGVDTSAPEFARARGLTAASAR